VVPRRYS